jgi:hypothetical protein
MTTATHNKKENIYTASIPFYLWIEETIPDYFEPMMASYSWTMDEFYIHFFELPDDLIQSLSKLSLAYYLDNKIA